MTTKGVPGGAMAVAIPIIAPTVNDEAPRSGLYITTFFELFMWDQSPIRSLCSLLAMCWFWPSGSEAEEKDLFMGSALLSLGRLLKDKLTCLAQDMAACFSRQRDTKGDKQLVTMGCGRFSLKQLILLVFALKLQSFTQLPQPSV